MEIEVDPGHLVEINTVHGVNNGTCVKEYSC